MLLHGNFSVELGLVGLGTDGIEEGRDSGRHGGFALYGTVFRLTDAANNYRDEQTHQEAF
jgi:hypothetical protein